MNCISHPALYRLKLKGYASKYAISFGSKPFNFLLGLAHQNRNHLAALPLAEKVTRDGVGFEVVRLH